MTSNSRYFLSFLLVCCMTHCCYCHSSSKTVINSPEPSKTAHKTSDPPDNRFFLQNIFSKYGNDGVMTFEGFEHLLESLGLIHILGHGLKDHREGESFVNTHTDHDHSKNDGAKKTHLDNPIQIPPSQKRNISENHQHEDNHHYDENYYDEYNDDEHNHDHSQKHKKLKVPEHLNITSLVDNHKLATEQQQQCLSPKEMFTVFNMDTGNILNPTSFLVICPAIIYELDQCYTNFHSETKIAKKKEVTVKQWIYAVVSILIISLCGVLSILVVPIMGRWFYHTLIQYLVGLAIGTLTGDALLHLIPHAIESASGIDHTHAFNEAKDNKINENVHSHENEHEDKDAMIIWIGLCALGGMYTFFLIERGISIITAARKKKNDMKTQLSLTSVAHHGEEETETNGNIGEKLSQHRKNSANLSGNSKEAEHMLPRQGLQEGTSSRSPSITSQHEVGFHGRSSFSANPIPEEINKRAAKDPQNFQVTVSDHHGHSHGHSHEVPTSITSVALMIIMGDGLHNFCDGIAIGTAFATSIGDGISTSVAVFCHELPHELGDFAMLIKTGMKVKEAVFYNILSSALGLAGMIVGVSLGGMGDANIWIFGAAAGMFLYISLVDMLPELELDTEGPLLNTCFMLSIQVLGLTCGIILLLLIALFEDDFKNMVS